ncbi:MAG: hypothetical protein VCC19_10295, partial [Myxococcota bacterium]
LFEADSGAQFIVDSTGFEVDDPVSITGCLDRACASSCQQGAGCIDGELVPEPGGAVAALTALSTLLLLRHRAARRHGRRPGASR